MEETHEESSQTQKKCLLCDKGFHFRKKIVCERCLYAFCSDHCYKEIATVEGTKTICDSCYHKFRREKIQEKISEEIELLNHELIRVKDANKRVERELFEKTSELNSIETEFSAYEKATNKRIERHKAELKDDQEKLHSLETKNNFLTETIKPLNEELSALNEKYQDLDSKKEEIVNNTVLLHNVKSSLFEQLFHVRRKIKFCLDYYKADSVLCERCKEALKRSYDERIERPQDEMDESSVSLYETQSVLDSVREMKESLSLLIVEPESEPKCLIT
ncbi:hypothetical protein SteCoe_34814 [Stentor coeruleus]|uniref:FYVE-type domain-containing protein n=1 Tax=Stentor coeruleus TaxID=5963 RepID=A0A1R2ATS5_9CILI|nr:hypothetical protein SteCoe_34814 [Stentor coeruleus]